MPDSAVAIITGAGSGIGRATALRLSELGWAVTLVGRTPQKLETVARELAGREAQAFAADVAEPGLGVRIVEAALRRFGRIDAIVNSAAVLIRTPIEKATSSMFQQTMAANVLGPAELINAAWPTLSRQGGGRIVNVSSMSAIDPFPGLGVYGSSKAALEGLTRAYAKEGTDLGIRCFAVAPGAVETPMLRSLFTAEALPTSRTLSPAEVARVIVDCAMGERDEQNGATIVLPSP